MFVFSSAVFLTRLSGLVPAAQYAVAAVAAVAIIRGATAVTVVDGIFRSRDDRFPGSQNGESPGQATARNLPQRKLLVEFFLLHF